MPLGMTTSGRPNTPTLVTNMVNGLPALGFTYNGGDSFYLENPITTDPRQLTVFTVFRQYPGDTAANMLFTHRSTSVPLVQTSFLDATNAMLQVRGSGNVLSNITASGLLTNGIQRGHVPVRRVNDYHAVSVNVAR